MIHVIGDNANKIYHNYVSFLKWKICMQHATHKYYCWLTKGHSRIIKAHLKDYVLTKVS